MVKDRGQVQRQCYQHQCPPNFSLLVWNDSRTFSVAINWKRKEQHSCSLLEKAVCGAITVRNTQDIDFPHGAEKEAMDEYQPL